MCSNSHSLDIMLACVLKSALMLLINSGEAEVGCPRSLPSHVRLEAAGGLLNLL